MTGGAVEESQFAGLVVVSPSALTVEGTVITASTAERGGVGVYAQGGTLVAHGVKVGPHPHAAAWFDEPGAYHIEESALSGSTGTLVGGRTVHGNAVYARGGVGSWDGATGLRVTRTVLGDGAGPAVLLDGASATLEDNAWEGDGPGLWQQRCEGVEPLPSQPGWTVCEGGSLLVDDTVRFPAFNLSTIELGQ